MEETVGAPHHAHTSAHGKKPTLRRRRRLDVEGDLRTCSLPAMIELVISVVVGTVLLTVMLIQVRRNKKASDRGKEQLRLAQAEGQTVPLSLHPVIDPTLCVGSFSCIKACPEGEIIGVVDGVATLVEAAHCIGHGTCATECPVGAIKLVFGTAEMGIDLPKADESFESSRAGVYIIGELGGMGLIKNALRQGLVLGGVLKDRLKKSQATQTMTSSSAAGRPASRAPSRVARRASTCASSSKRRWAAPSRITRAAKS
jgi:Pyruvate/2-oxoacid:ferredoxin oxidoreductase delta subunit